VQYHYVLADFLCAAEEAAPKAGDDAAEAKWVELSDLTGAALTPHTQRVVLKAAGMRDKADGNNS
jgi:ADP-ribose pyrophosphatase YjhB (NUDIX family)